ncbi:lymphocyte antigen 6D-like isoform X1 [Labrus mixtus]|uniref:lymphocyte antigen 6D-like isoform X1 n=1 Tax=Labrus mixtus TaxID=508554 RepID=UPI0029C02174|nr:lymphocyte antigen 6D-like isoform X1 [Labrus mixtus]
MKLLLTLCLACSLLSTAESLRCHMCDNDNCSNSTSVTCPVFSACRTITSLRQTGPFTSVSVNKSCSSLLSCFPPLNTQVEWSVNVGVAKEGHHQLCCTTDNCNFPTLAVPNTLANGKQCPVCGSLAESQNGTCNSTLSCQGVEDRCFNGTRTSNSTQFLLLGCISGNLCSLQATFGSLIGGNMEITCGAPRGVAMSAVLLTFAVAAHKVLL